MPRVQRKDIRLILAGMFNNAELQGVAARATRNYQVATKLYIALGLISPDGNSSGEYYNRSYDTSQGADFRNVYTEKDAIILFLHGYYLEQAIFRDSVMSQKFNYFMAHGLYQKFLDDMKAQGRERAVVFELLSAINEVVVGGGDEKALVKPGAKSKAVGRLEVSDDELLDFINDLIFRVNVNPMPEDYQKINAMKTRLGENHPVYPLLEAFQRYNLQTDPQAKSSHGYGRPQFGDMRRFTIYKTIEEYLKEDLIPQRHFRLQELLLNNYIGGDVKLSYGDAYPYWYSFNDELTKIARNNDFDSSFSAYNIPSDADRLMILRTHRDALIKRYRDLMIYKNFCQGGDIKVIRKIIEFADMEPKAREKLTKVNAKINELLRRLGEPEETNQPTLEESLPEQTMTLEEAAEILGVSLVNYTEKEIVRAFRSKSREYHPDALANLQDDKEKERRTQMFYKLVPAKDLLMANLAAVNEDQVTAGTSKVEPNKPLQITYGLESKSLVEIDSLFNYIAEAVIGARVNWGVWQKAPAEAEQLLTIINDRDGLSKLQKLQALIKHIEASPQYNPETGRIELRKARSYGHKTIDVFYNTILQQARRIEFMVEFSQIYKQAKDFASACSSLTALADVLERDVKDKEDDAGFNPILINLRYIPKYFKDNDLRQISDELEALAVHMNSSDNAIFRINQEESVALLLHILDKIFPHDAEGNVDKEPLETIFALV